MRFAVRKRHERNGGQRLRGSRRVPTLRTLFAWLVPLAGVALVANWALYQYAIDQHRKHGHMHLPKEGVAIAFVATGTVLALPLIWLQLRKPARPGASKVTKRSGMKTPGPRA